LSGRPSTSRTGFQVSTSRVTAAKRAALLSASMLSSGCATPSAVSPTATPMWRRPKSKASTVPCTDEMATDEAGRRTVMPACSCMAGLVGEAGVGHAEQLHGRRQAFLGRQVEDDLFVGRHGEPGVLLDLVLELPGRPARIAQCH